MPILRGAVTFSRFRVDPLDGASTDWKRTLSRALRTKAHVPLDRAKAEERSAGFVELEEQDRRDFSAGSLYQGDYALFSYRVDEFRIPASVVRAELERWAKAFEKEHQRLPGRREKTDAKAEIRHTLKARAPIVVRSFDVSWNLATAHLQVWAASRKMVDEVQTAVEQSFKVSLVPLVPVVAAETLGIDEKSLKPTPELSLPDVKEHTRGEA
jgi:recombination associated protein RdgC